MTEKTPQRRLLEAMVTINAINNGRPVPDMDKIHGGWVTSVLPGQSRQEIASKLIDAIKADGVTVSASDNPNKGDGK
ncbi:MAG: hypothetical protein CFH41_00821 [Alphaproteobacteria bacterium MarineAlpha11_Bin1]|nr:MAG: hypothetical protein CFH41_00821 [Alphaproteobacteria bacterium MarineAlpha11_Bin1]|tara:strand:- start:396 stop:626 length:231 start_codon:yes stop_codon:yes gene_type:complete